MNSICFMNGNQVILKLRFSSTIIYLLLTFHYNGIDNCSTINSHIECDHVNTESSTSRVPATLLTWSESETSWICITTMKEQVQMDTWGQPPSWEMQHLNQKLSSEGKSLCCSHWLQVTTFGYFTSDDYNPGENTQSRTCHVLQTQERQV